MLLEMQWNDQQYNETELKKLLLCDLWQQTEWYTWKKRGGEELWLEPGTKH